MVFTYITDEKDIPMKWDILFRTYGVNPNTEKSQYIGQAYSNLNLVKNHIEHEVEFDVNRQLHVTAEHPQGIKSFWHKFLRYIEHYDEPELHVVFLNEHKMYWERDDRDWMRAMYKSSLVDNSYDEVKDRLRIKIRHYIELESYFNFGKFQGCRITNSKEHIGYFIWLSENTHCTFCPKIQELIKDNKKD